MQHVKGVVFDLDGTLVSSALNFSEIKEKMGCAPHKDPLDHISSLSCKASQREAMEQVQNHEREDALKSEWIPGAKKFVHLLASQGVPMAIVTRNSKEAAAIKLSRNRMPIGLVKTRECAPAKPDPEVLFDIADRWRLRPSDVMVVGDFIYDLQAARNARMTSCLIYHKDRPNFASLATYSFSSFDRLQRYWLARSA